jgi:DNA gyrase subunit A
MVVSESDEVMIINSDGIIIRIKASDVSRLGRATQGVRIMKVAEDSNIIAMAKVVNENTDEKVPENAASNEEQTTLDV